MYTHSTHTFHIHTHDICTTDINGTHTTNKIKKVQIKMYVFLLQFYAVILKKHKGSRKETERKLKQLV